MKTTESLNGKHFIAQQEVNNANLKCSAKFGGGMLKAGDVIKVTDEYTEIDTPVCATDKLLHKITKSSLLSTKFFIQLD